MTRPQAGSGLADLRIRTPLIGREAIVETLYARRVVVVRAEPGGGKTRLLAESRARANDAVAVHVRCHASVVATHEPLEAALAAAERAAGIVRTAAARSGSDADRLLALRERFEYVAADRSLLVQIDDVHFAPSATVDAIAFCIDRTRDSAIRWQLATRPLTAADVTFEAMRRDDDCVVIDVPPLSEAETEGLARSLTSADMENVYRLTGGNPLYVEQLSAARARPEAASTLRAILDARLAELSDAEASVAAVLAAANRPLALRDLATLLDRQPADLHAIAARLAASGIAHGDGEVLEFAHDLLRDACYDALGAERRKALHERLLEVVTGTHERAHHLLCAGRGDEAAHVYFGALRDALSELSYAEASAVADRIARVRPLSASNLWQLDAARAVIEASRTGYPQDNHEWQELISRSRATDGATRGFFFERMIAVVGRSTDPAAALVLDAALADPEIQSDARALLLTWKIRPLYYRYEDAEAIAIADAGLAIADPHGDVAFLLHCLRAAALGSIDPDAARAQLRALTDAKYRHLPSYTHAFLSGAGFADRIDDAEAVLDWAKGGVRAVSGARPPRGLHAMWAWAALCLGRTAEGLEACAGAEAMAVARGSLPILSQTIFHIIILIWRDDLAYAGTLLARTRATPIPSEDRARVDYAEALLHEARGDAERALAAYAAAAEGLEETTDSFYSMACAALVRLYALGGDRRRARAELARLSEAARRANFARSDYALARFYAALCDTSGGDAATAREAYAGLCAEGVPVLPRALASAHLGERLRDRNALLEAIAAFDRAGAAAFAERARAAARTLGFRPRSKPAARETLTQRETEVVRAIAQGKTNREIAAALFVSPKTIAACVSGVLVKCGLRSRVEIAAHVVSGKPFVRADGFV